MARTTASTNGCRESAVAGVACKSAVCVHPAGVGCTLKAARHCLQDSPTATAGDDIATATATATAGTGMFIGGSSYAAAAISRSADG
jgi:hypothetical protein